MFFRYGAKLVEINPLALTTEGIVIASDAKVELDDDGLFRTPEFKEWHKTLPLDEDESLASNAGLGIRNFRRFPGTVGTMANGAGLAMATMDAVKNAGGEIANFLDVGGGANAERVRKCYELVVNHTGARCSSSTSSAESRAATKSRAASSRRWRKRNRARSRW